MLFQQKYELIPNVNIINTDYILKYYMFTLNS